MRISVRFLLLLIPTLLLAVVAFLYAFNHYEQNRLVTELSHRARLLTQTLQDTADEALSSKHGEVLQRTLDRISRDSRLVGLALCSPSGETVSRSESLPSWISCEQAPRLATTGPELFQSPQGLLHRSSSPTLSEGGQTTGYLLIVQDPAYADRWSSHARNITVLGFVLLGILLSALTLLVHRWSVSRPIAELSAALKSRLRQRNPEHLPMSLQKTEFAPLVRNLDEMITQLQKSKPQVAHLDTSALWTAARLKDEVYRLFGDSKLAVIANREPYIHNKKGSKIEVVFPASGLVSAMEPIVRACSGLWIGHGSGSADRETADARGVVLVPPNKPAYALKRIWLTREEEQGYYYGFANEGLWPLCHIAFARPTFRLSDWQHYVTVNGKFATAFAEEMAAPRPIALIQDYHFALLPGILRKLRPDAITSLFWHIPWPNAEAIGICPWRHELVSGMLGADLIGFHTQDHCNNFLDTVDRYLEARVDRASFSVTIRGHTCFVKPFPIGIEWPAKHEYAPEEIPKVKAQLFEDLGLSSETILGVGVDRLDYTKGIVERFLAVERLLELHPEWIGKFVFVQICAPSRTHIQRYQDLNFEVQEVAERINFRFRREGYDPIVLRISHHSPEQVFRFYAASEICLVTSLHDGMNLVAKEYVASHSDLRGALVLSSFAGAAREMTDAFIVNPYDTEDCAQALHQALSMDNAERADRMSRLRSVVANGNIYGWAANLLYEISRIASQREVLQDETL
jgi:trehalose 6-phosphate synthase